MSRLLEKSIALYALDWNEKLVFADFCQRNDELVHDLIILSEACIHLIEKDAAFSKSIMLTVTEKCSELLAGEVTDVKVSIEYAYTQEVMRTVNYYLNKLQGMYGRLWSAYSTNEMKLFNELVDETNRILEELVHPVSIILTKQTK